MVPYTSEVLALDVEELDLGRKRAAIRGKGGHREIIVWGAATARLLPRYLAGRRRGPLFVTAGRPNLVTAELDRSPDGRGRLSYQRAWSLFRGASGGQWTLHQLRHSALTHLARTASRRPCSWRSPAIETSGRSRATCVRGPQRLPDSPPSTPLPGVGSIHDARAVTHRKGHDPGKHQVFVPLLLGPRVRRLKPGIIARYDGNSENEGANPGRPLSGRSF